MSIEGKLAIGIGVLVVIFLALFAGWKAMHPGENIDGTPVAPSDGEIYYYNEIEAENLPRWCSDYGECTTTETRRSTRRDAFACLSYVDKTSGLKRSACYATYEWCKVTAVAHDTACVIMRPKPAKR